MDGVGFVDVAHVSVVLPDGRVLLDDVSFRVGEGVKAALVGANGAGKTTLLRMLAGDLAPRAGARRPCSGGLGVMRAVHRLGPRRPTTVRDLLLGRRAAGRCGRPASGWRRPSWRSMEADDEPTQLRYANALADWGDAGGYDAEVAVGHRDRRRARRAATTGRSSARCGRCRAASRSGWCWRRCCAARTRCCCSTSRTTTSTCPASGGWRSGCAETPQDGAARQPRPGAARPRGRPAW